MGSLCGGASSAAAATGSPPALISSFKDTWASVPAVAAPTDQPKAVAASVPSVMWDEAAAPYSKPSSKDSALLRPGLLPGEPRVTGPGAAWLPPLPQPLPAAQPAAAPVAGGGKGSSSLDQSSLIPSMWPSWWEDAEADGSSWDPETDELLGSLAELEADMDLLPNQGLHNDASIGVSCTAPAIATKAPAPSWGARGASCAAPTIPQAGSLSPGSLGEDHLVAAVPPSGPGVGPAAVGAVEAPAEATRPTAAGVAVGGFVGPSTSSLPGGCSVPSRRLQEEPWQVRGSLQPELPAKHAVPAGQAGAGTPSTHIQDSIVRLSVKIFDVSPDQLPKRVLQEIVNLVSTDPIFVDCFVRPGCTHVTVSALLTAAERERLATEGCAVVARRLLQCGGWLADTGAEGEPWAANMLVQLGSQVAVVRQGRLAAVSQSPLLAPKLVAARPQVMQAQNTGQQGEASAAEPDLHQGSVMLWGYNLGDATRPGHHDAIICRQAGRVLTLEVLARGLGDPGEVLGPPAESQPPEWVLVRPLGVAVGLLEFEVQRGGLLSEAVAVVAVPGEAAAEEAQQAQRCLAGGAVGAWPRVGTGEAGGQARRWAGDLEQGWHPGASAVGQ
ncbi:hypothetical protein N2152v2_000388 [Parachlorella kessleri]